MAIPYGYTCWRHRHVVARTAIWLILHLQQNEGTRTLQECTYNLSEKQSISLTNGLSSTIHIQSINLRTIRTTTIYYHTQQPKTKTMWCKSSVWLESTLKCFQRALWTDNQQQPSIHLGYREQQKSIFSKFLWHWTATDYDLKLDITY